MKALSGLPGAKKVEFPKGSSVIVVTRETGKPSDEEVIDVIKEQGKFSPRRVG